MLQYDNSRNPGLSNTLCPAPEGYVPHSPDFYNQYPSIINKCAVNNSNEQCQDHLSQYAAVNSSIFNSLPQQPNLNQKVPVPLSPFTTSPTCAYSVPQYPPAYSTDIYGNWLYYSNDGNPGFVCPSEMGFYDPMYGGPFQPYDLSDPRCFRRRLSANKKERRRTQSINNAFSNLRDCIPNVPYDTKLSKIKTLRLATKYIEYLMQILDSDDGVEKSIEEFRAEIGRSKKRPANSSIEKNYHKPAKVKCRTGWPQDVWVNELNTQ